MKIETAEKAKKILSKIELLKYFLDVYSKSHKNKTHPDYIRLAIMNYSGVATFAQIDFDELDDDFLEATIIKDVVEEKKRLEKELEELC